MEEAQGVHEQMHNWSLLEALDLLLLTLDDKPHVALQSGGVSLSWQDLLDAVVLLVRWHCRASALVETIQAKDTAHYVMTLPLQATLEFPFRAEMDILDFLGVQPDSPPNFLYPNATRRDEFILRAWTRVHVSWHVCKSFCLETFSHVLGFLFCITFVARKTTNS